MPPYTHGCTRKLRKRSVYDGPRGDLTSPRYCGRKGCSPLSDDTSVSLPPTLELAFDDPSSLPGTGSPGSSVSHDRYAGGSRPDVERCKDGTGPASSCLSVSASLVGEPG